MPHHAAGPHNERRAQPRMKCDLIFNGARITRAGALSETIEFSIVEISAGGIRFTSTEPFDIGDEAVVEMIARTGGPRLVGLSIVHHAPTEQGQDLFGARFTALHPERLRASA